MPTDFTTSLPVIVVLVTCPAGNRGAFQLTSNPCRDNHQKTWAWLCVFVLSFLSSSTYASFVEDSGRLKACLPNLTPTIEKSDAMLYAPSITEIIWTCKKTFLKYYIVELLMVIEEEEVDDSNSDCISHFNATFHPEASSVTCPPCEAFSLRNITIFLERLNTLLEAMAVIDNM